MSPALVEAAKLLALGMTSVLGRAHNFTRKHADVRKSGRRRVGLARKGCVSDGRKVLPRGRLQAPDGRVVRRGQAGRHSRECRINRLGAEVIACD